jgi:hypothetical protein
VAPSAVPGLLGRLFGRVASAQPEETTQMARAVQKILSADGTFSGFRWRWDGFPDDAKSTPEPIEAKTHG